MVVVVLK